MNMQQKPKNLDHSLERTDIASSVRVYLIGGVALVLLIGGYWYWGQGGVKAPVRRPAIPVQVSAVTRGDMAVVEHTLGTVVPNTTVQIASRVSGTIDSAPFKEGQVVKKGDLLFVIDPRPYEAAYKNATATLASTKSKAERYQRLSQQNAISPQDVDDAQAAYLEAEASVDTAKLNLEFTHIRSPVDGKTGPMLVQPGNTVIANLTTTPLVTIDQIHPVKVSFALPQSDLPRIQARQKAKGLTAMVGFQGQSGAPLSAPVDFISNAVNNVSGTIEMRSIFKNEDDTLVPGQLVNVTVQLNDIPGALTVPDAAVNIGPDGTFVYVLKDGKAVTKPITVLFDDSKNTAITGDLEPGDQVVTEGQLRLVPGSKVVVEGAVKRPVKGGKGKGKGKRGGGKEG
jgi:multidrug efflux system membrane fusion protein